MTPAINLLKKHKISHKIHRYKHDPGANSYGMEAAEKLAFDPARVFKTLAVELDSKNLAIAVIPVASKLNMKLIAKAVGAKKAQMADPKMVEKTTGYILGGVSPLGQKKRLQTTIDSSAMTFSTILVSAGRRGLDIEIAPRDLGKMTGAEFFQIIE